MWKSSRDPRRRRRRPRVPHEPGPTTPETPGAGHTEPRDPPAAPRRGTRAAPYPDGDAPARHTSGPMVGLRRSPDAYEALPLGAATGLVLHVYRDVFSRPCR